MDPEKKILSAGPPVLPQTLDISIVFVVSVIHQEGSGGGGGAGLFCPSLMSASAFQARLKLHLSVNLLVNSFRLLPLLLLLLCRRRLMADTAFRCLLLMMNTF